MELKTFNMLVRDRAKELNITREKLSKKMGVTPQTVYFNTCLTNPTIPYGATVKKYAKALDLSVSELKFAIAVQENGKEYYQKKHDLNGLYLHQIIEHLKKYYGATCDDLAAMCKVSSDSIYKIWSQTTKNPKRATLNRIKDAFNLHDTQILKWG